MRGAARDRLLTVVITVLVAAMLVLVYWRAYLLIRGGTGVGITLGVAVVVIATVGTWLLARSFAFGYQTQRLARRLESEDGLPVDDLPRRASGRAERDAADAAFDRRRAEVDAAPDDWRAWFRVAVAYDDAGDRSRAREAMRRAIALERQDR
jgi:hypothetical protein